MECTTLRRLVALAALLASGCSPQPQHAANDRLFGDSTYYLAGPREVELAPGERRECVEGDPLVDLDRRQLTSLDIGGLPGDLKVFVSTDCDTLGYSDCSGRDLDGRVYGFFDGYLSQIIMLEKDMCTSPVLPADMVFGEDIEAARVKAERFFKVELPGGVIDGVSIYSSDYIVISPEGAEYSIEIASDERGRLVEVKKRTMF